MLPKSAETKTPNASERPTGTASRNRAQASRAGLSQTVAAAASLLDEGDRAHAGIATDARDLLLDEIAPDVAQPRRRFDPGELQALADDIARRGVLQPILVRPPAHDGEPYRLVAGERRWRAARLAGKVRIPVRIRILSDDEVQAAQLAENVLRAELTDIEKGRALRRLYELRKTSDPKTTWEDIAGEVGLGRSRIHDLFHLAELPEAIGALIEAGRLSGSHGIQLQRVVDVLDAGELLALAHQAARPDERRTGAYGMSVDQLRQRLMSRMSAPVTKAAKSVQAAANSAQAKQPSIRSSKSGADGVAHFSEDESFRPAVQEILNALAQNALTQPERTALFAACERSQTINQDG